MDVSRFLSAVQQSPHYDGQICHVEQLPERAGQYREPLRPLPSELRALLASRGIQRLYEHQTAALDTARADRDLVVVTGTASGKTLCYNLPILETCLEDPTASVMKVVPAAWACRICDQRSTVIPI